MEIYINGLANISPQDTLSTDSFLENPTEYHSEFFLSKEPNYKDFIEPVQIRRMGRILKMGVSAAKVALNDGKIEMPDAIITGTGLGCMEDTEKFLTAIINDNEQYLTPTSFIQSTHNTVSGQIALLMHCNNYNSTYVHRGFSFESALMDGMLLLNEGEGENILVGGIDEHNQHFFSIKQKLGLWKSTGESNLQLFQSTSTGTISGEGAAFFVISTQKRENTYAKIDTLKTFYKPKTQEVVVEEIQQALHSANCTARDIDLVIWGYNGNAAEDSIYHDVKSALFHDTPSAAYKHLSGEYHTASAFALWLGAKILKTQQVPAVVRLDNRPIEKIKRILIYTHFQGTNHAATVLSAC
ncbi:MAG: beta-ketoacyl synthase chain length factor [Cytophagales bacterium]|nr:beta-ketoacyl synthase chain length factor [Cytophagales bacterium]